MKDFATEDRQEFLHPEPEPRLFTWERTILVVVCVALGFVVGAMREDMRHAEDRAVLLKMAQHARAACFFGPRLRP
jgi:hypothetical protein